MINKNEHPLAGLKPAKIEGSMYLPNIGPLFPIHANAGLTNKRMADTCDQGSKTPEHILLLS